MRQRVRRCVVLATVYVELAGINKTSVWQTDGVTGDAARVLTIFVSVVHLRPGHQDTKNISRNAGPRRSAFLRSGVEVLGFVKLAYLVGNQSAPSGWTAGNAWKIDLSSAHSNGT
jgi:hypothetical protein